MAHMGISQYGEPPGTARDIIWRLRKGYGVLIRACRGIVLRNGHLTCFKV